MRTVTAFLVLGFFSVGGLFADTVDLLNTQVYNTGVANSGVVTSGTESHYVQQSAPDGPPGLIVQTPGTGAPIPPRVANSLISAWIGPNATNANGLAGQYDYRITFDLTGLDPATAILVGQWATDNQGDNIRINGASTDNSVPSVTISRTTASLRSIPSRFPVDLSAASIRSTSW